MAKAKAKRAGKKTLTKRSPKKAKSGKRAGNAKFMAPVQPDKWLALVVGEKPIPRTEVVKKLWAYIRKHGLQDTKNRRNIRADEKLAKVFNGKMVVSMFEMTKLVNKHLK